MRSSSAAASRSRPIGARCGRYAPIQWNARDSSGSSLPYTGLGVVQRIITDLAVIDVTPEGLVLRELAPEVTEDEVRDKTEPALTSAL